MAERPDFDNDHAQRIAAAAWDYVTLVCRPHDGPGFAYVPEANARLKQLAETMGVEVRTGSALAASEADFPLE